MSPEEQQPQRKDVQRAETASTSTDNYLMPGIVQPIVDTFLRPRKHFTTRGVARVQRVTIAAVNTALFRDLYREIGELRSMVGGRSNFKRVA